MLSWLLPREVKFFDFFDQHAEIIVNSAKELQNLVSGVADVPLSVVRIKDFEHQADTITHHCIEALHKIFITPIDREDIFRLISHMDDVVDCIDVCARLISIFKISEMTSESQQLADLIFKATQNVEQAVRGLRDLKNAPEIQKFCFQINKIENEADLMLSNVLGELFEKEKDLRKVIKWKDIYETMELATDRCEDVANVIDGIIIEQL